MQPMLLQQMKSRSQLVYNKRLDAFTSLCITLYEIILLCALAVSDSPSLVTRKRQALRAFASRSSRNPWTKRQSDRLFDATDQAQ